MLLVGYTAMGRHSAVVMHDISIMWARPLSMFSILLIDVNMKTCILKVIRK